jgi:hypothetical protein
VKNKHLGSNAVSAKENQEVDLIHDNELFVKNGNLPLAGNSKVPLLIICPTARGFLTMVLECFSQLLSATTSAQHPQ